MMKRVSFSLAETYEADVIKKYQHLKKCSFSAAIKECLKLGAPVLNRINENIAAITDIEDKLRQFFNEEPFVQRTKPEITKGEFFHSIYKSHIKYEYDVLDRKIFPHESTRNAMGVAEKKGIKENATLMLEYYKVEKAICIYTNRKVSHILNRAGGFYKTILIKTSVFGDCFFDFCNSVCLPIDELIEYGMKETVRRHQIRSSGFCTFHIPIFYINNKAVIVPVLRTEEVSQSSRKGGDVIIINPFEDE
ncbi:hypothetical protein [Escherichia coli]|uniref:hypothetical protein n=1 Tax=Escherichia coli TaxID=562 RepID=UPI0012612ECF|nr:hypothetical protein [Escherichia coli]